MNNTEQSTDPNVPNLDDVRSGRPLPLNRPGCPVACPTSGASLKSQDRSAIFCFSNRSNQPRQPQRQILRTALSP
jgi:hypothetical protein